VVLSAEPPRTLGGLLQALPSKESHIMDHMRDLCQKFIEKGLLEFTYVHHLLWEYVQEVKRLESSSRMEELITQLGDSTLKLMSTKPGARVCCVLVSAATAKDRKRMIKSLKGHVLESLNHDSAHLSVMRLVDVTDDTVNVQKSLLEEIRSVQPVLKYTAAGELIGTPLPPLISIAKHRCGRKLLLRLLAPNRRHLEPDEEGLFYEGVVTSKKLPAARRKEHITYIKNALLQVCTRYPHELVRCQSGEKVLEEVVATFYPAALLSAVARVYAGQEVEGMDTDDVEIEQANEAADGEDDDEEDEEEDDDEQPSRGKAPAAAGADEDDEGGQGLGDAVDDGADWTEELEEIGEDDEEEGEGESKSAAAKGKGAVAVPVWPIEEDPVAHRLLKKLIHIEAAVTARRGAGGSIPESELELDDALWEKDTAFPGFAATLLGHLVEQGSLEAWLTRNRPCLSLADMFKIPSETLHRALVDALLPYEGALTEAAAEQTGPKVLLGLLAQHKPAPKADKKTPKKKARA
jgi:CPL (NUC119) domain